MVENRGQDQRGPQKHLKQIWTQTWYSALVQIPYNTEKHFLIGVLLLFYLTVTLKHVLCPFYTSIFSTKFCLFWNLRQSGPSWLLAALCLRKRGLTSVCGWMTNQRLHPPPPPVSLRHRSSAAIGPLKPVSEEACLRQNKPRPRPRRPLPPRY